MNGDILIYVVKPGDTLNSVARTFGVSPSRLISDNGLENPGALVPGQALAVLIPDTVYTVKRGDTLYSIARTFGVGVDVLFRNNPTLVFQQDLEIGQTLAISYTEKPTQTARVNGYAYEFIDMSLLRRDLPFLSTLTIFGYGFNEDGSLIDINDTPLISAAYDFGAAPILLLSSITENGNFSTERASLLFNDVSLQNRVLNSLVAVMREKGYLGLDIDFEFVSAGDSAAFVSFIENSARVMHENGFFVNVDLAPKTSADQKGLLYEAHDYARIGAAADTVLIMTYEWGYRYGPPLAIAPINQVRRVAEYAVSEIPNEKVMLGIPNYAYDWALPYQRGITSAVTIGNQYAPYLASRYNTDILFDETAQSPYFYYSNNSVEHVVWFEDPRSVSARFDLIEELGLRGAGYWNLQRPFNANFALLSVRLRTIERVI